jgi:hypothetical protein
MRHSGNSGQVARVFVKSKRWPGSAAWIENYNLAGRIRFRHRRSCDTCPNGILTTRPVANGATTFIVIFTPVRRLHSDAGRDFRPESSRISKNPLPTVKSYGNEVCWLLSESHVEVMAARSVNTFWPYQGRKIVR